MLGRVIVASLSSVALIALALDGLVFAADRPVYKAPPMEPTYNWTGFYLGGHLGWGAVDQDTTLLVSSAGVPILPPGTVINGDASSFIGGSQIGYNWQTNKWVFGVEGDFSWAGANSSVTTAGTLVANSFRIQNMNSHWYTALTGRIGYAWDNWLLYGKGGAAWMNASNSASVNVAGVVTTFPEVTDTRGGWTLGVGIEQAIWNSWSWKLEYDYMAFGTRRYSFLDTTGTITNMVDINTNVNAVKVGLNYRWGAR